MENPKTNNPVRAPLAGAHENTEKPKTNNLVGAPLAVIRENGTDSIINNRAGASPAPTVGDIIRAYKSLVVHEYLKICTSKNEYLGKIWQRNYYEHIIRDEDDYNRIREYICENPLKWQTDENYRNE